MRKTKVSYIIPCYNEADNIRPLVSEILNYHPDRYQLEIIFINDGSTDATFENIYTATLTYDFIKYINFSKNFGHQFALKAGIDASTGDCVIMMDADLQHPPQIIPQLLEKWEQKFDIVQAIRKDATSTSWFKKWSSKRFYMLLNRVSDLQLNPGSSDFRLIDKKIADIIRNSFNESFLFLRGVFNWLGFKRIEIEYVANSRFSGKSKYSLKKMIVFAIDGLMSFTTRPLRLATYLGAIIFFFSFIYLMYILYSFLFTNQNITGWTSIMVSILFLGSIQLIFIGLLGEYIGKIFMITKNRPLYIVKDTNLTSTEMMNQK